MLAALKEKQEQAKRQKGISQEELDCIANEVGLQQEIVDKLKEQLELAEKKADKYNLVAKLAKSEALQVANVIATNLKSLAELRDQFNQLFGVDASKGETLIGHNLDAVIDDLSAAADGISKVVSAAQSGDVIGVVSGAVSVVTGIGDAVASVFGDGAARTKKINKEINKSVETVRQLNMAYKELEQTVSKTMGDTETLAKRQQIANKEAQLAELERRQALEQSKRGKDRDEDAIKQNQESIQDLRLEIQELKDDVVSNLLGSDVKSAAEEFVDTWVEAWKAGETTLDAVKDKMDEVIINLIKKAMASKIVGTLLEPFYKMVDDATLEASEGGAALTTNELLEISNKAGVLAGDINTALGAFFANLESLGIASAAENSDLSALQQGIQAITEDTAGALEAYMNGMSQQVYLHSDLLTQIRDAVVELNTDLQLGAMTQILIQLQASYQVQMSIQTTINGWSNPSGQAVRVELIA